MGWSVICLASSQPPAPAPSCGCHCHTHKHRHQTSVSVCPSVKYVWVNIPLETLRFMRVKQLLVNFEQTCETIVLLSKLNLSNLSSFNEL